MKDRFRKAGIDVSDHAHNRLISCLGVLLLSLAMIGLAAAQESWPNKPIRLIVTSPAGGPSDIAARIIGDRLWKVLGQAVIIDNRGGANGIVGTQALAAAAPDGYTIGMIQAGLAINPSLYDRVPYDPIKDFEHIAQAISVPNVLVVHPSFAVNSAAELVSAAKAKPGEIPFASAGVGSSGHLALELLQTSSGARFNHVPFKGGAPAINSLLGGEVKALFSLALVSMPHVRSGRLRALAVTSAKRSSVVPELPTISESGYPGFDVTGWFGLIAPKNTPGPIVARLHNEVVQVLNTPETRELLKNQGADVVGSTPAEWRSFIRHETEKWADVIKGAGIGKQTVK
jgi:tripartite-type tricarboxylate transporter receptor subunit TctC